MVFDPFGVASDGGQVADYVFSGRRFDREPLPVRGLTDFSYEERMTSIPQSPPVQVCQNSGNGRTL